MEDGHLVCRSAFNLWFRGHLESVDDEGLTSVYSRGLIHLEQCWRVPRRPRHGSVWPDFSPPCFWQTSPGRHRNAFSKTHDKDFGAPCLLPLMSSEVRSCHAPLSLCLTSWLNKEMCIYANRRQEGSDCFRCRPANVVKQPAGRVWRIRMYLRYETSGALLQPMAPGRRELSETEPSGKRFAGSCC